jgi:hypothetical protein
MVTLEQIKLLETKVIRAIDVVTRITGENACLKGKLENYQKRIDELEVLIQRFKEDQGRIEDGILSALDRLNEFEAALENSIAPGELGTGELVPEKAAVMPESKSPAPKDEETGDAQMFSVPEGGASGEKASAGGDNGIPGDSGGGTTELEIF